MSKSDRGRDSQQSEWRLYVEDGVLIAEFPEGMPSDRSEYEKVNERFETLAARSNVHAHLSWLKMDAALNADVFEKAQEAAAAGLEYDITKWVMVSDGIKSMALESQVGDIEGVETNTANTFEEGMDWARN
ncbi:hypothetical protein [Halopiger xanaduensis]|uniref:Uncharacterized protein n=1 Tax=Halopiger xanaduensis (strain DSM 18323 / JCM 14033 / SH-6) TaxID=797210 RepID=F8D7L6_HALXS|nr:hypothetical protein [Halopiger xanaduensis]AEH36508.1 hypothetical protein Halxa_1881 [Halopiger xanaduensis SH-6]